MIDITERDKRIVEIVEDCICDMFSTDKFSIYDKNHCRENSIARGYIWYTLHNKYGLSVSKIAIVYSRNRRGVSHSLAKTKYLVENICLYRERYEEIEKKVEI